MSDTDTSNDELAEIRRRKREQYREKLANGTLGDEDETTSPGGDGTASSGGTDGTTSSDDGTDGETNESSVSVPNDPINVEDAASFREAIETYETVLVDFYADWCGPCKQLEPIVERLAADTAAAVAKVDVDRHRQLAGQYQVRSMPTLILFHDGEPVEQVVGARGYDRLARLVRRYT